MVSRSGTLTYQIGNELAQSGFGNSSIVGIGGDPVPGSSFIDVIELFQADPETELIVLSGEIGGDAEERAADYIAEHVTKPVVAYIAGFTAPPGKTMGHAGAIVSGSEGTAQAKAEALEAKGVRVGRNPTQVAEIAIEILGARGLAGQVGERHAQNARAAVVRVVVDRLTRDVHEPVPAGVGRQGLVHVLGRPHGAVDEAGVPDRVVEPHAVRLLAGRQVPERDLQPAIVARAHHLRGTGPREALHQGLHGHRLGERAPPGRPPRRAGSACRRRRR